MEIDERIKPILERIGFVNRYRLLSKDFNNIDDSLQNYSNEEVKKVINDLGYQPKYFQSENFFRISDRIGALNILLNFSLKYGSVEFILDVVVAGERCTVGGPFGMMTRLLGVSERIKKPIFTNYDELKQILLRGFSLYEEIKSEMSLLIIGENS